jgi:lipopolysaccharide export system permease protein
MRACGISITRLALPVLLFGITAGLLSFTINEFVVPAANYQTKLLTAWAIEQKNIPDGKTNFSFKEMNDNKLKRLFYIDNYTDKTLKGITVLDVSRQSTIQILQSKYGTTTPDFWNFQNGVVYTISNSGKTLNTTIFDNMSLPSEMSSPIKRKKSKSSEFNFIQLVKHINHTKDLSKSDKANLLIDLNEKFAIPVASVLVALIGIPLAITPPRARFNRGLLFSILVIFLYYLIRAFSISIGESQIIDPILSAWLPDLIIFTVGGIMFYRKAYLI